MKKELLAHARRSGARTVESVIAWGNDPMITINTRLGAEIIPIKTVWGRGEYVRSIVRVN